MSATLTAELLERAKELSQAERFQLAHMLLREDDELDDEAWAEITPELNAISAALDSGAMETIPLEEVQRRIRERIARSAD